MIGFLTFGLGSGVGTDEDFPGGCAGGLVDFAVGGSPWDAAADAGSDFCFGSSGGVLAEVVGSGAGAFFDLAFFFIFRDNSLPPASRVSAALPPSRNCKTAIQPKTMDRAAESRTFQRPDSNPPSSNLPIATRINRRVGCPMDAVIRRTWRFFPSVRMISNQTSGTLFRKRIGGVREETCGCGSRMLALQGRVL